MWADLDRWLDRRKMLSANTRDQYLRRARACDRWLRDRERRIEWATTDELRRWLDTLPTTPESRAQGRKALAATFAYLVDAGRRRDNPVDAIERTPTRQGAPRPCPSPTTLLTLCSDHSPVLHVFASLLLHAGLRFSEARLLPWDAVRGDTLRVTGKGRYGGKVADMPLNRTLAGHLARWKPACPSPTWVIAVQAWRPASETALRGWWHAALDGSDLADVSPHQARHRFGTDVLAATGNLAVAQDAMRHASPQTTRMYADLDQGWVRTAVDALDY